MTCHLLLLYHLIPVSNNPILASSGNLTRLLRMPLQARNRLVTRLQGHIIKHLATLPIPEAHLSITVTRRQKLSVGRDVEVDAETEADAVDEIAASKA